MAECSPVPCSLKCFRNYAFLPPPSFHFKMPINQSTNNNVQMQIQNETFSECDSIEECIEAQQHFFVPDVNDEIEEDSQFFSSSTPSINFIILKILDINAGIPYENWPTTFSFSLHCQVISDPTNLLNGNKEIIILASKLNPTYFQVRSEMTLKVFSPFFLFSFHDSLCAITHRIEIQNQ